MVCHQKHVLQDFTKIQKMLRSKKVYNFKKHVLMMKKLRTLNFRDV